jgi:glycosyltransferase involved in cell wall biosynthesis
MFVHNPLVSVIIPTYNYAHYIGEAIASILNSDFPQEEIEIIVVDDGSTDGTAQVVEQYGDRVHYIWQENFGKAWATYVGIQASQGKYIFNLDADDWFYPDKIRQVVDIFEQDPELVHVAHPAKIWDMDTEQQSSEVIPACLLGQKLEGEQVLLYFYRRRSLFGGGSTFAGRGDTLRKLEIPKTVDMFIDEYLILFTLIQGYSFFIPDVLSVWRVHGKNYSNHQAHQKTQHEKILRNLANQQVIWHELIRQNAPSDIQKLYGLKWTVANIAAKESLQQKTAKDIIQLWGYFLQNLPTFWPDSLLIIRSYTLLNRSLVTGLLHLLRQMKYRTA